MLSFFDKESLEQDGDGRKVGLRDYRERSSRIQDSYHCVACGFDDEARRKEKQAIRLGEYLVR